MGKQNLSVSLPPKLRAQRVVILGVKRRTSTTY